MEKKQAVDVIQKGILLLIAIIPILYFNQVKNVPVKAFLLGSGSWGFGLILKMIAHQLVIVNLHKKKVSSLLVSVTNGFLSGLFELLAAYVIILLMKDKFAFNYDAMICFGLAIGSFESLIVVFNKGEDLLKGTSLEETTTKVVEYLEHLRGMKYYTHHLFLPIIERIMAIFIHISTRGLVFVMIITKTILPLIFALVVFIVADGLLGYYYNITGKLTISSGFMKVYSYLLILTVVVTGTFFILITPYKSFVL